MDFAEIDIETCSKCGSHGLFEENHHLSYRLQ